MVPLLLGVALGAATWLGLAFSVAWVAAYPTTYFLGRSIVAIARRGVGDPFARREALAATPWAGLLLVAAMPLLASRSWLVVPALGCGALWTVSVVLAWAGRERGIANDLLLVALASLATPLLWMTAADAPDAAALPAAIRLAALVCLVFFTGSVLHVKSLIREAGDRRWRVASIAFHALAVPAAAAVSPWLAVPAAAAAARSIAMRPGLRPGRIGAVEAIVSLLVVVGTVLATR